MQAVRESYADIGLMRERGLSWAEISDILAKLGITARDNQPISPVTLRSAFFLVGNEGRDGAPDAEEGVPSIPAATLDAVHRAALESGRVPEEVPVPPADDRGDGSGDGPADAAAETASFEAKSPEVTAPETMAPEAPDQSAAAMPAEAGPGAEPPAEDHAPEPPPPAVPVPNPPIPSPPSPPDPPLPSALVLQDPPHQDLTTNILWKGDRMLGTIFVLNDRGGVGKTLLSHHLMATAMLEGLQLKVVEYEVNERLARLFGPEVVEHRRITQDFMNMMGSGDGFYEFWDLIGPELQRGGRLYDFGGNISQWFFNWAEVSGFDYYVGEGERLTFMVPVTVDLASLSTGMNTLERIATIAPKAKRVLVENGFSGPFSQLEDSQYARRKAEMVEREGVEVISMAPCTAPAWARLTGHRIDQVAQMTREDLVKLGMTPPVASRSLIIIHEWLRTMRQSLSPYLRDAFNQTSGPAAKGGVRQGVV